MACQRRSQCLLALHDKNLERLLGFLKPESSSLGVMFSEAPCSGGGVLAMCDAAVDSLRCQPHTTLTVKFYV